MKPKQPWRRQNIGDVRSIAHLPRRAASLKPRGRKPKTEAVCAGVGDQAAGGGATSSSWNPAGAITSWQMLGKELQACMLACWSLVLLWNF